MISKEISVAGAALTLFGYPADPYFQDIETHLAQGPLIPLLAHHVQSGATLIDVGANIGGVTALMNHFVKDARVVSLEPSNCFRCLEATIGANSFANTTCLNMCVGDEDGMVPFMDCGDYDGTSGSSASHSHIGAAGVATSSLTQRKLDTVVDELGIDRVDFVKIDVEGFEENVLDGMTAINRRHEPMILMEFNSFTISVYARRSPYGLLDRIRKQYGGFIGFDGDKCVFFSEEQDLARFLHRNMTERGCVEDIVFSAAPGLRKAFRL